MKFTLSVDVLLPLLASDDVRLLAEDDISDAPMISSNFTSYCEVD